MCLHPAFEIDTAQALAILRERAFGLFTVPTSDAPFGVHVPFLVDEGPGHFVQIALHVARANPIHTHIGEGCQALLACIGPDAYVSPDWYEADGQVPSWLYAAVHVTGRARIMPSDTHLAHVDRLAQQFETRLAPTKPWSSKTINATKRSNLLEAIVAITIESDAVHAQKKLLQHKGEKDQNAAADGLRACGDDASVEIATLISSGLMG